MAELSDFGGPGFYQERLRGRKSGRISPRNAVRGPRREEVYAAHGLIDQGAADPRQGQLFDTSTMQRSVSDIAEERGLTPASVAVRPTKGKETDLSLAGSPGFLPNLSPKQKVAALNNFAKSTTVEAPIREALSKRQFLFDSGKNEPWYSGVDSETGEHDLSVQGDALDAIDAAARRQGVSEDAMTRAVALTSPRNRWAQGTRGQADYQMPNIQSGEGAIREAKSLPADASDEEITAASNRSSGRGLPKESEKAIRRYRSDAEDVSGPLAIKGRSSQKVPNFEHSLKLSSPDQIARRIAAESYTVDTHDAQSIGVDDSAIDLLGVYDVAAMTGTRNALKNRQLPPNAQARYWEAQRRLTQSAPLGPLFQEKTKGKLVPNPNPSIDK
jgi:hypothetical protein